MPTTNITLSNPFAQQNPLNQPLVAPTLPKQNTQNYGKPANFGNVSVTTKNPILIKPTGLALPKEEEQKMPAESVGFWASKSKKQKTLIVSGIVVVVAALGYFLIRKK